jgi:integrating conjugative element membrane protein (TIGR03747 family)
MPQVTPAPSNRSAQQRAEPGLIGRTLTLLVQTVFFMFSSLVIAILIEWLGISYLWEGQGAKHSAHLLAHELSYLSSDFKRSVIVMEPLHFAQRCAANTHRYLFQKTGIERAIIGLATPDPQERPADWRRMLRQAYRKVAAYPVAAMTSAEVFAVRVAVLVLSLPAVLLLALIAGIDGLVLRDIRRWSGGRESAFVYHWAKKVMMPSLFLPWAFYLVMPVSIHPNFIVLPFALIFACAIRVMTATFKKYL